MHPIDRAAKLLGSQQKLAEFIGVTKGAVSQWKTAGVPVEHCPKIERLTNGSVRCEDMRPEVDWAYLRATNCPIVGADTTATEAHQEVA